VNIYLDDSDLKREIKIAAANRGVTLSAYCVDAIRQKLDRDRSVETEGSDRRRRDVAEAADRLRAEIGPVGIPVRELIDEGRRG
jgi:hypothetical protein